MFIFLLCAGGVRENLSIKHNSSLFTRRDLSAEVFKEYGKLLTLEGGAGRCTMLSSGISSHGKVLPHGTTELKYLAAP